MTSTFKHSPKAVPPSPLDTRNMRIKALSIRNSKIKIDSSGMTRETVGMDQFHQMINISCDGKLIKMRKGEKERIYSLDILPQKYYKEY